MSDLPRYRAHPDSDGWINTLTVTEAWADEEEPGIVLDDDLGRALARTTAMVAHYDGTRVGVPHDDRVLWRALRASGRTGGEACGERTSYRALQAQCPDIPAGVTPPSPLSHRPDDEPSGYDFADVPGLRWVSLRYEHLDLIAALAIETGLYPAQCPNRPACCRPAEAHAWLQLANRLDHAEAWQMMLEFQGQPLQFELVLVPPQRATISLTMHFTRERPHWFWREAERPIFQALRARGYQSVRARTRKDRPDWIDALKRNYGAVEVQELDAVKVLEFPLDLARFSGWPARRSAGVGWSWSGRGGVVVREMQAGEYSQIRDALGPLWGSAANPAAQDAQRRMEEYWNLDRGTTLLGIVNGQLVQVHSFRERRPRVASGVVHTRVTDPAADAAIRTIRQGFNVWAVQVGYDALTGFVPETTWNNVVFRRYLQHIGVTPLGRWTKFRQPMIETTIDLAAMLARSDDEWNTWTPTPPLPPADQVPPL